MSNNDLQQELASFAQNGAPVLEGALLVARIIDPDTDTDWCRERIEHLAMSMGDDVSAIRIARKLRESGFCGSEDYYKSENSALEHVLRKREGIPISLACVVLAICDTIGLRAHGINFPSHFLVSVESSLMDPFSLQLVDEQECLRWLEERKLQTDNPFAIATPRAIVGRMLNNLSMLATANDDSARALEISDYKLVVVDDPFFIHMERVELWLKLGVNQMAKIEMEQAIELAPDDITRQKLKQGITQIEKDSPALH